MLSVVSWFELTTLIYCEIPCRFIQPVRTGTVQTCKPGSLKVIHPPPQKQSATKKKKKKERKKSSSGSAQ